MKSFISLKSLSAVRTILLALCSLFFAPLAWAQTPGFCLMFGGGTSPILTSEYTDIPITIITDYSLGGTQPLSVTTNGNNIDVVVNAKTSGGECQNPPPIASRDTVTVVLQGKPAGSYRINLIFPQRIVSSIRDLIVSSSGATTVKAESLIYGVTQRYFLTANSADLPALGIKLNPPSFTSVDGGSWPLWTKADAGFKVWPVTGTAPAAAKPVCRFFNSRVATHFYSANTADCDALRGRPDWVDEGTAFRVLLPQNGVCQLGTIAVYRVFSAALANHRYTSETETVIAMAAKGWVSEGVAFCSPN